MGVVRRFAVAGLDDAARRRRRRRGLVIGAIDETGQEKAGEATCGVKRQYLGCAGQVANGINTVHVAYVRERTGHALIGARQWIPARADRGPGKSLLMGLPPDLGFRTKGQLAIDISTDAAADGIRLGLLLRRRGVRPLHRAARALRSRAPGLRAAGAVQLHAHPRGGHEDDLRGRGPGAAETPPPLGGPLRRRRLQGPALVRLGLARHRLAAPPPADPPPPQDRRAGLSLLFRARRPAADQDPADQGGRAALADRRRFRIREGLLRARPVPGPALHRDRPPRRPGHGRPGHLRRHRRRPV